MQGVHWSPGSTTGKLQGLDKSLQSLESELTLANILHTLPSHNLGPEVIDDGKRAAQSLWQESGEAAASDKGKPRGTTLVWSPA